MVVHERDYLPMCPTPPAPVRAYKIKVKTPFHLKNVKTMYTREAPPEPQERFTLSAMHAKLAEELGDDDLKVESLDNKEPVKSQGERSGSPTLDSWVHSQQQQQKALRRGTCKLYDIPSAADAAIEREWSPYRPVAPSSPATHVSQLQQSAAGQLIMSMTAHDSLATTLRTIAQGCEPGQPCASTSAGQPKRMDLSMNKSIRNEHLNTNFQQRAHFISCPGRLRDGFVVQYGPQHTQLLRDIETDEMLVKLRQHRRQELLKKAQGQLNRSEIRSKMDVRMARRMHESLLRKEPHAIKKLEKALKDQTDLLLSEVTCRTPVTFGSPKELSQKIVTSMRSQMSTVNTQGSHARPHTARTIRSLKSEVEATAGSVFVEERSTSARFLIPKSRALLQSQPFRRAKSAKEKKLADSWDLTAAEVISELDSIVRKASC